MTVLLDARLKRRYTQVVLASKLGVAQQYLSLMESGKKPLNKQALLFIDDTLGCNMAEKVATTLPAPPKSDKKVVTKRADLNNLQAKCNARNGGHGLYGANPEKMGSREWERWWWRGTNAVCGRCKETCKQSDKVKVVCCPQFKGEDK